MGSHRHSNRPLAWEIFERSLEQEISISREFGLPVSVLIVVMDSGGDGDFTARAIDMLRAGDLICRVGDSELAIALPNTSPENARIVERRLREVLQGVRVGLSAFEPDDTPGDMLARARDAASG